MKKSVRATKNLDIMIPKSLYVREKLFTIPKFIRPKIDGQSIKKIDSTLFSKRVR